MNDNNSEQTMDIVLHNPVGSEAAIVAGRRLIMDRQRVSEEELDRAISELDDKMRLNAFDAIGKMFDAAGKQLASELAAQSGADALFVQLAASSTAVKNKIKEYQEKLRALKAEHEPPAEKLEYIIELCVTQKDYESIVKRLMKDGIEFRSRRVMDNESAKIGKLFEGK